MRWSWLHRSACPTSSRSVATSRVRTGPLTSQNDSIVSSPGWRCIPTKRRESLRSKGNAALDEAWSVIENLAGNPRVRAVGETGLDYFRTGPDGRTAQEESFRRHIAIAKRYGKALVIHDRDSHDAVLRVLAEEGAPETVVFHCFSGDAAMARYCVDAGLGLVVRRNSDLQECRRAKRRAARCPARPGSGGDRRAVPHPDAVQGPAERELSHSLDSACDERGYGG